MSDLFRDLIIWPKRIKLCETEFQLENPGHGVIIGGKLGFVEEAAAVIWKLSLASGSTGICLRKIDHSLNTRSSSASRAKEDPSSGDDNEERTIPQAEAKH